MTEEEILHKWLHKHYAELKDNEELKAAHRSGLLQTATRIAIVGVVFIVLCLLMVVTPISADASAEWQEIMPILESWYIGMCSFVAFLCCVKSLQYFLMRLTRKSFEDVEEGRGFIPLELIARLKKEYESN